MSFRNTFTTSFIYQASNEVIDANPVLLEIFERWCGSGLVSKINDRGYGYFAGFFKSLSGDIEVFEDVCQVVQELEKATKVPFTLVVLPEWGPVMTYQIIPTSPTKSSQ